MADPARPPARRPLSARLAAFARRQADMLDPDGAPRLTHLTFTFEDGIGLMLRTDGHGCRLAYMGRGEYARAHDEAGEPEAHAIVWLPHRAIVWPPVRYIPLRQPPPEPASWVATDGLPGAVLAMYADTHGHLPGQPRPGPDR